MILNPGDHRTHAQRTKLRIHPRKGAKKTRFIRFILVKPLADSSKMVSTLILQEYSMMCCTIAGSWMRKSTHGQPKQDPRPNAVN